MYPEIRWKIGGIGLGIGIGNREGIGLSYQPARLHKLAELIPCNRFLASLKV
jgi:hypothetical protein